MHEIAFYYHRLSKASKDIGWDHLRPEHISDDEVGLNLENL